MKILNLFPLQTLLLSPSDQKALQGGSGGFSGPIPSLATPRRSN